MATVPTKMRAAAIDRFGPPRVLKIHTLPAPQIDPDEVLIAVHTTGVGSWDADIRGGWWPGEKPPRFPLVLGTDGSGIIAAIGSRVRRWSVGDRVYAYTWLNPKGGFYAEYVAVAADKAAPIPKPLDLQRAGAIPVTGLTALQGVDDALHLKRGESVIIHGASGGVGTMAVQFARLRGARVMATASGEDGLRVARRLGAEVAVEGKRAGDIRTAVREFAPDGVDAVLALVGKNVPQCLDALRRGGRAAYPNGVEPAPRKRKGVKIIAYDAQAGIRYFERLNRAVEESRLKVIIAAEYPLAQAARAHQHVARGHVVGKVVLRIKQR